MGTSAPDITISNPNIDHTYDTSNLPFLRKTPPHVLGESKDDFLSRMSLATHDRVNNLEFTIVSRRDWDHLLYLASRSI
ncbi:hypothetical protein EVB32_235 [Rhizobium phage RHph_TM39]|uniref:Uncharacterized protein n=1 Tax=Rhizobium phage RHph_TM30 TaxID=2509764 RepID=A0A7S5UVI3_9CAUD|nr:hypothetical protein PQC16_gp251 [Rhizobium phage RHph_TM30]QIG71722.1 hypothetical protein EVB94_251 [Rhizobium phage RHph_TM40]QIG72085.1 hypothetical protein EVB95_251 [Rhizobium phage RHph_TM2_3B]QIG72447.1 hypothetical protein EVB96_251 [Rhizobium phage RHph_TM3_3_6]QIG77223.1 hypothetical protein EVB32_235 [Rhizobium phage RHph_TM39]QIG77837.1 hypothetical protein EVB64_250 [Rhizobium phage RHph_TM61]